MKDIEILLRGFAMLVDSENYAPSMVRFLNQFSRSSERNTGEKNTYLSKLFGSFLDASSTVRDNILTNRRNNRFNIALYEAVFTATCEQAFKERRILNGHLQSEQIESLANDRQFIAAAAEGTTATANVRTRLSRARDLIAAL